MAGESQQVPSSPPDPTTLTTEQMLLAVDNLEKLVSAWRETDQRSCREQFDSIKTQLTLIERQRVEQKKDTKDAVDAALAAAKEAVKEQTSASERAINKSEVANAENVKQQGVTLTLAIAGVTTTVNDLKERVVAMESNRQGVSESRNDQRLNVNVLVSVVGLVVATIVAAVILANFATGK